MSLDYINEAFRSLEFLTEDVFKTNSEGIKELSDFMSSDVDSADKISIIDMDAETEDDLQDSYVGKVIVDCNVCHSHVFKDKGDIKLDEQGEVDLEEDCPYCGENNGFVIIGEIHEFNPNTTEEESETSEEDVEETDDSIEESLTEESNMSKLRAAYPELAESVGTEELNELFGLGNRGVEVVIKKNLPMQRYTIEVAMTKLSNNITRVINRFAIDKKVNKSESASQITWKFNVKSGDIDKIHDALTRRDTFNSAITFKTTGGESESNLVDKYIKSAIRVDDYSKAFKLTESFDVEEELEESDELNELFGLGKKKLKTGYLGFTALPNGANNKKLKSDLEDILYDNNADTDTLPDKALSIKPYWGVKFTCSEKDFKNIETDIDNLSSAKYFEVEISGNPNYQADLTYNNKKGQIQKFIQLRGPFVEALDESFKNVSLETEDQRMTMTSEDNGKVTVTTEPIESELDDNMSMDDLDIEKTSVSTGEQTIAPVSDETANEILDNNTAEEATETEQNTETETPAAEEENVDVAAEESTEEPAEEEASEEEPAEEEATNESLNRLTETLLEDENDNTDNQEGSEDNDSAVNNDFEALLTKLQATKDYHQFVELLKNLNPDQKKLFMSNFGKVDSIKPAVSNSNIPVVNLIPTQSEIDYVKSLDYNLKNDCSQYFKGAVELGMPVLTFNSKYIIDGHHRWSQIFIFNPKASAVCNDFKYDQKSPIDVLKDFQGAILAKFGKVPEGKAGTNIFTVSEADLRAYIEKNIQDVCWQSLVKVGVAKDKASAINYIMQNAMLLKEKVKPIAGAPERTDMPQTDLSVIDLAKKGITDMSESIDLEFEEVDEDSMSNLGESYLKKVYENVDSFKLTSCSTTPTQLILEGLITFKSGVTKNTGFIFEAKDATADGKVRFIGENAHLARGRKSFTLAGKINESKKLVCESLTYNYRAKTPEGKSTRVYGKVNHK